MSAPVVTGVYAGAVVLLGAAGIAKAVAPADTATALRRAGVPLGARALRALAVGEVALAVAALAAPGPLPALLVAASYAAFTAFIAVALARGLPLSSCGCFGRADTPPSWTHVVVDAAAALAAVTEALSAHRSPLGEALAHPELALGALVAAGLAAAVLTNPLAKLETRP